MNIEPNPALRPQLPRSTSDRIFFGEEGLRPGWGILLFFVFLVTFGLAVNFLARQGKQAFGRADATIPTAPHAETSPGFLYINEGLSLSVVLLATLAIARIEQRPFTTYGLGGPYRVSLFARGLLCGIVCLSLLVATLHFTGHLPIGGSLLPTSAGIRYGTIWAIGFTLVAFLEETLLRGYLQYTLTRGLRAIVPSRTRIHTVAFWTAALILSFLFGLGHRSNPGESPLGLLAAGIAGLVFSFALYRTGSLWWALGFHASWDWAQSFLYGVPDSGTMVQHHLLATHPAGPDILSGGLTGPEGSIYILPTLALVVAIVRITLPTRNAGALA